MKALFSPLWINRSLRSFAPTIFSDDSLFVPTTGRWLWNEPQKVQQHTLKFDLKALKHLVAKTVGLEEQSARVEVRKLAEGGSNKVMTATVGQQRLIVKLPDPLVPRRLITASEVATLEFLRVDLDLPVPKVLAWSDCDDNAVGCEYIILEEAVGADLKTTWPKLGVGQRMGIVDQLIAIQERLLEASKSFKGYGSLYFAEDAAKFEFQRHIEVSTGTSSKFVIGPLAHRHFMDPVLKESDFDSGPWYTPHKYLDSLAHSSLSQIKDRTPRERTVLTSQPFSFPTQPVSDLSNIAVCQMLELVREITPYIIPRSSNYSLPLLWHQDLMTGIFLFLMKES